MIEELRITSLGIIDASALELGPGLTVITGETGAGKTMIVTALGLLLGGRADSGAVRTGAKHARIEGVLHLGGLPDLVAQVDDAGGTVEDDRVVLARNVSAEGRSRAWVGGASVPVATLGGVADPLVAVHGQSDQHRLLAGRAQREALDRFAGPEVITLREQYVDRRAALLDARREHAELVEAARERAREADRLRFGLGEIEALDPKPGEDAELSEDEARLGFADTLRGAAEQAREALSSESDQHDALSAVAAARGALEAVRDHDREAAELADRLAELTYLLSDLGADVASYATRLESDPSRLAQVSGRRAALTGLTRKYGDTIDDVLEWSRRSAQRLLELDGTDDRITELAARAEQLAAEVAGIATELSLRRGEAATRLSAQVTGELTLLAMPDAVLEIDVRQSELAAGDPAALAVGNRWLRHGGSGVDEVDFLLAANTGSDPRPLAKGASGGELSRVMLALEVSLAGTSTVPTFVFDEVDAGVGGKAAVHVGRRLAELAKSAQVLVVTHLPQVAAFADTHVVVAKSSDGSITTSGLQVLATEERERELSRMFAGLEDSETALAHARELLAVARNGT